jgi:hypothetical protein
MECDYFKETTNGTLNRLRVLESIKPTTIELEKL